MRQTLPTSAGVCYRLKDNGFFQPQIMQTRTTWSREAIHWLDYLQSLPEFQGTFIEHALNIGERCVEVGNRKYNVDGYCEINGRKIMMNYDGCLYHNHDCKISRTSKFTKSDDRKRNKDLQSIGTHLTITSCEFNKIKKDLNFRSSIARFLHHSSVNEDELITAVFKDEIYGLIKVNVLHLQIIKYEILTSIFKFYSFISIEAIYFSVTL